MRRTRGRAAPLASPGPTERMKAGGERVGDVRNREAIFQISPNPGSAQFHAARTDRGYPRRHAGARGDPRPARRARRRSGRLHGRPGRLRHRSRRRRGRDPRPRHPLRPRQPRPVGRRKEAAPGTARLEDDRAPGRHLGIPREPPASLRLECDGRILELYHGSPASDTEYVTAYKPMPASVEQFWDRSDAHVLLLGHTHIPMIERGPRGTVINPGSTMGVPGRPDLLHLRGPRDRGPRRADLRGPDRAGDPPGPDRPGRGIG